jgi:hypothetical protein
VDAFHALMQRLCKELLASNQPVQIQEEFLARCLDHEAGNESHIVRCLLTEAGMNHSSRWRWHVRQWCWLISVKWHLKKEERHLIYCRFISDESGNLGI